MSARMFLVLFSMIFFDDAVEVNTACSWCNGLVEKSASVMDKQKVQNWSKLQNECVA